MKNAADEREVTEATRKERDKQKTKDEDIRFVLSTVQGRRFFYDYIVFCGVFKTTFTGNSETFFKEGQRNVGLRLLEDMNRVSPEAYALMMKENNNGN